MTNRMYSLQFKVEKSSSSRRQLYAYFSEKTTFQQKIWKTGGVFLAFCSTLLLSDVETSAGLSCFSLQCHLHCLSIPSSSPMGTSVVGADSQTHPVSSARRSLQSLKCFPVFHISPKTDIQVFFLPSPCLDQASLLSSFLSENIKKILTPDLIRSRLAFLFLRIVNKITLLKKNPGWNVNAALI